MGQKLLDALQGLAPEEADALMKRVEAVKAKRAAAKQYQDFARVQQQVQTKQTQIGNYVGGELEGAYEGLQIDPFAAAVTGMGPSDPEETKRLQERQAQRGTAAFGHDPGTPAPFGSDIEGAQKAFKGTLTTGARGDQYGAWDSQGNPIAVRNEPPSLPEHIKAAWDTEDASWLGVGVNALQSLARPAGTALVYADDLLNSNLGDATFGDFLRDMKESVLAQKGHTVHEGGRAMGGAGAGFGDFVTHSRKRFIERNPNATGRDMFPWATTFMPEEILGRPLKDWTDEDDAFVGDMWGFLPIVGDPLNIVGGKLLSKGAPLAARGAAKVASKLPAGAQAALSKAGSVLSKDISTPIVDRLKKLVGAPVSEGSVASALRETPELANVADELASQVASANVSSRAETAHRAQSAIETLERIAGGVSKERAQAIPQMAENLADLDPGVRILKLRKALMGGATPRSLATSEDLAAMGSLRNLDDETLQALAREDTAIAEKIRQDIADTHGAIAGLSDDDVLQIAIEHGDDAESVMNELVQMRRMAAAGEVSEANIDHLRKLGFSGDLFDELRAARGAIHDPKFVGRARELLGLEAEGEAWQAAKRGALDRVRPVHERVHDFGRMYGVDLFQKVRSKKLPTDVLPEAKEFASKIHRPLAATEKRIGFMAPEARVDRWFPRPPKPEGPLAELRKPYNPRARRMSVATENLDQMRKSAWNITRDEEWAQALDPADRAFLADFATNTRMQREEIGKAKEVLQRATKVAGGLDSVEEVADTAAGANAAVKKRTGGNVGIEQDPVKATAQYVQAVLPGQARGSFADKVAKLQVGGKRVIEDVENLLADLPANERARMLTSEGKLQRGQATGPNAVYNQGELTAKGGGLAPEAIGHLREKGWEYIPHGSELAKKFPAWAGKAIPREFEPLAKQLAGSLEEGALDRVAGVVARLNRLWVPLQLNTLGFHARNFMYGMFQLYLGIGERGILSAMKQSRPAYRVAAAAEGDLATDGIEKLGGREWRTADLAALARKYGVVETGLVAEVERNVASRASYADETLKRGLQRVSPFSQRGLIGKEPIAKTVASRGLAKVAGGFQAGSVTAENWQRTLLFLERIDAGLSPEKAAKEVTKFLFDYTGSQLSQAEKSLRKVFPFYQWLRFSTMQTVEQMLKQPQKYASLARLFDMAQNASGQTTSDPVEVPKTLQDRGAVYMPKRLGETLGLESTPESKWMLALERPGAQLNMLGAVARHPLTGSGTQLLSQAAPVWRAPFELGMNRHLFGGAPVSPGAKDVQPEDVLPYLVASFGGPNVGELAALLGMNRNPKVPGSDEAKRVQFQGLSMLTGLRAAPFRPADVVARRASEGRDERTETTKRRALRARSAMSDASTIEQVLLRIAEGGGS